MKVLGAELVAFFESEWPEDYYVDDSVKTVVDGNIFADKDDLWKNPLPLDEKYELSDFGELYSNSGTTLTSFFSKWKKAQTIVTVVVLVPKEKEGDFRAMLKDMGLVTK